MQRMVTIFFIAIVSFSVAAQREGCPEKDQKNYACGNVEERIIENLPDRSFEWNTTVSIQLKHSLKKSKQKRKAKQVLALVDSVLNDADFWRALRDYPDYRFAKWSEKLDTTWRELKGEEIIQAMLNKDPWNSSVPKQLNLNVTLKLYGPAIKTPFETAIGKDGGNGTIMNKRWFFRGSSIIAIGSNWAHEIAHGRGFRHCSVCHEERDYSVPYVVNRIFREIAERYIDSVKKIN